MNGILKRLKRLTIKAIKTMIMIKTIEAIKTNKERHLNDN